MGTKNPVSFKPAINNGYPPRWDGDVDSAVPTTLFHGRMEGIQNYDIFSHCRFTGQRSVRLMAQEDGEIR